MMHCNTCFGAYFYSAGTQQGTCLDRLGQQAGWVSSPREPTRETAKTKANAVVKLGEELGGENGPEM